MRAAVLLVADGCAKAGSGCMLEMAACRTSAFQAVGGASTSPLLKPKNGRCRSQGVEPGFMPA